MAPEKVPDVDLLADAPITEKVFIPGAGETQSKEWNGTAADVLAKYEELKDAAQLGGVGQNIREIRYGNNIGRGRVIVQFARTPVSTTPGIPADMQVVEELYGVDIIRDVRAAPYFCTGGAAEVTDDEAAIVSKAVERKDIESAIIAPEYGTAFSAWTDGMKQLRYHMLHGNESYYETGFVLRRSKIGVITSDLKQTFLDINKVVDAPIFLSDMDMLIYLLPEGEWLYRPPSVEYLGGGKWRVQEEWHWAEKWSKMYGGSWGL